MPTLPFPPYEPDKNNQNLGALSTVLNVVPHADGFGPLPSIIPTPPIYRHITYDNGNRITFDNGNPIVIQLDWSDLIGFVQLPAACIGFFAARKKNGEEVLFAGTVTTLYRLDRVTLTWLDVSSTTYAAAVRWSFARKGSVIYCQNGYDTEQKFDIEVDTVFSDNPTAPICKYICRLGPFIFRANIVSWAAESFSNEPAMIMCSSLLSPADNIPFNLNYCDYQIIDSGDEIMGIVPMTDGAHVWTKGGVVPLSLTVSNDVTFTLGEEDRTRGTSAPYSLCSFGQDRYLAYGDDGFLLYQGSMTPIPIGQDRVNVTFLQNVDQDTFVDVLSMNDPEHAIIWISYTNTDGDRRMLGYQWNINQFTASDIEVSASFVCRTFVYADSDPPILVANQPRFTIIDRNGQLGYLVGNSMAARITTNEAQLGDGRSFQNVVRLNGDPVDFSVTTMTRDKKGGAIRTRAVATPSALTGAVPFSAEGLTHQWQIDIPAGEDWTNVTGMDVPAKAAGKP